MRSDRKNEFVWNMKRSVSERIVTCERRKVVVRQFKMITTVGILGLVVIGSAIAERKMYKQGKEQAGHIINTTTKTILIVGGIGGAILVLIHAVGRLL